MYKYRLIEQEDKVKKFHEERIMAFDILEARLEDIKKLLRQAKIETIKYYRENPNSYCCSNTNRFNWRLYKRY